MNRRRFLKGLVGSVAAVAVSAKLAPAMPTIDSGGHPDYDGIKKFTITSLHPPFIAGGGHAFYEGRNDVLMSWRF